MKHIGAFCIAFWLSTAVFALQQGQPPRTGSGYGTPQALPDEQQKPEARPAQPLPGESSQIPETKPAEPTPPDQAARPGRELSSQEVEQQITHHFSSEPGLENSNINARVTADSVVLSGTVETEEEHERAVRIVRSYAGKRQILDKIKVRQQT